MLSNKPYLIRAFNEWILDSGCTPFVVINANFPQCKVPEHYVEDGQITLNISANAVRELKLTNEFLECRASFSGVVHFITAPIKAILAIYAQENGQGMFFDFEEDENFQSNQNIDYITESRQEVNKPLTPESNSKKRPSHLKLVE